MHEIEFLAISTASIKCYLLNKTKNENNNFFFFTLDNSKKISNFCQFNLQQLTVNVDSLKNQLNTFYIVEQYGNLDKIYGMNNESNILKECYELKIEEINPYTKNKTFFKCDQSSTKILGINHLLNNEYFINVFV